jgi:hypothetical protein
MKKVPATGTPPAKSSRAAAENTNENAGGHIKDNPLEAKLSITIYIITASRCTASF